MDEDRIQQLRIKTEQRQRPRATVWLIWTVILLATGGAVYFARPWDPEKQRLGGVNNATNSTALASTNASQLKAITDGSSTNGVMLTVSGYIVNRERIEISPRFMGLVTWIGVKKGDTVTNGQVVVLLDDAEYQARRHETEGRLENAHVTVAKAELDFKRAEALVNQGVEMQKLLDDCRLQLASARAGAHEIEGQLELIKTYLDWTVIKSPINGVVLEKLTDANELVTPQSFGGTRGPSTALLAVADPKDLQVEIDLNEADLAKVQLRQKCQVSPEAYPDKHYAGLVAEIAPEASRQKGTLQVKVQILDPDRFLTPELSAKVDFLK